jgi:hypothetical protein
MQFFIKYSRVSETFNYDTFTEPLETSVLCENGSFNWKYEMFAMVIFHGTSLTHGHYTSINYSQNE